MLFVLLFLLRFIYLNMDTPTTPTFTPTSTTTSTTTTTTTTTLPDLEKYFPDVVTTLDLSQMTSAEADFYIWRFNMMIAHGVTQRFAPPIVL